MLRRLALVSVILAAAPHAAAAQLEVQGFLGSSVSVPSPLSIAQKGQPDVHITAHWATRPFHPTWYYAARVAIWRGTRGWALDFTHHKVYLTAPPDPIQRFELSNGLNMIALSRTFRSHHLSWAVGAGPVVTFPISRVRGRELEGNRGFFGGYFLSGATAMAGVTRRFPLAAGVFLSVDSRLSVSYVRVPIADGHASVPNLALHLHAGLGYGGPRR